MEGAAKSDAADDDGTAAGDADDAGAKSGADADVVGSGAAADTADSGAAADDDEEVESVADDADDAAIRVASTIGAMASATVCWMNRRSCCCDHPPSGVDASLASTSTAVAVGFASRLSSRFRDGGVARASRVALTNRLIGDLAGGVLTGMFLGLATCFGAGNGGAAFESRDGMYRLGSTTTRAGVLGRGPPRACTTCGNTVPDRNTLRTSSTTAAPRRSAALARKGARVSVEGIGFGALLLL